MECVPVDGGAVSSMVEPGEGIEYRAYNLSAESEDR